MTIGCAKKFMFWGHDGDLFATSVIKRDMGDVKTHFWNLGRPYQGLLCIHIYLYVYILHQNVHICSKWD